MPRAVEVHVVPRNLRWEVRVNGVARRMIDWLCTKERAVEHALERAREIDAGVIVIEEADFGVEDVIHLDRGSGRYALVA